MDWLSPPTLVTSSEFHTTSEWLVMRFSQNGAFCLDVALLFHIWLWAFMSPAIITWLCLAIASQLASCAGHPTPLLGSQS